MKKSRKSKIIKQILLASSVLVILLTSCFSVFADIDYENTFYPVHIQDSNSAQAEWNFGINDYNQLSWYIDRKLQGALTSEFAYATNDAEVPIRRAEFYLDTYVDKRVVISFGVGTWYSGAQIDDMLVPSDWVGNTIKVTNENGNLVIEVYKARSLTQYYATVQRTSLEPHEYSFDQYGMITLSMYYTINLNTNTYNLYLNTVSGVKTLFTWELESINADRIRFGMFDAFDEEGVPPISIVDFTYGWVDDGYNEGYQAGLEKGAYEGYLRGKDEGEDIGFDNGKQYAEDNLKPIWEERAFDEGVLKGARDSGLVIDVPNVITSIFQGTNTIMGESFDFEIFGINILGALISILVVFVVIFIVKKLRA